MSSTTSSYKSSKHHELAPSRTALTIPAIAPPNGNYSHSNTIPSSRSIVYLSGFMGDLPGDGRIISGGVAAQTTQIMRNLKAVLVASGSGLDRIAQRRVFLVDMGDLKTVDRIWGEWIKEPFPVSTCVQIVRLVKEDAKVEIEVVAETK
ncbi:hypothetical protein SBOR_4096 [Sclerotinia borealis F-4128]|uniref:Uncharacterized protein n=1 Tax=Sclerotinia borealis (strain F-4128) TaxID=1432307 RepID=W9CI16_SCLBF|nr:hypothetical protein SBOR_4096 [Sclerotinia borealis F-4128]